MLFLLLATSSAQPAHSADYPAVLRIPNLPYLLEANPRSEWSLLILCQWHSWFEGHNDQHERISLHIACKPCNKVEEEKIEGSLGL